MTKTTIQKLIVSVSAVVAVASLMPAVKVYADCETNYGGGQTCVYNKSFRIEKKVARLGDNKKCEDINSDDFSDKITNVKQNEAFCFKIRVKNMGEIEVDGMKMSDSFPDELVKPSEGLSEDWDNFAPDQVKTFFIQSIVKSSEYDKKNFEKCVVNKTSLKYGKKFEGSDTATVCYKDGKITELPKTGLADTAGFAIAGAVSILAGVVIKLKKLVKN